MKRKKREAAVAVHKQLNRHRAACICVTIVTLVCLGRTHNKKQTFSIQQMIIILRHRLFLAFFYTISDLRLTVTNSSKCSAIEGIFFFNNNSSSSSSFYKKKDFLFSLYIFYLFLPFPTDLFVYSFCVLVFFGMVPRTTIIINPSSRATTRATKLEENSKKTTN